MDIFVSRRPAGNHMGHWFEIYGGFSRLRPNVITVIAMIASFALLAQPLKTIPVGTGYAVWTGYDAADTAHRNDLSRGIGCGPTYSLHWAYCRGRRWPQVCLGVGVRYNLGQSGQSVAA